MKIFTYKEYVDRLNEALEAEGLEKIDEYKSPLDLTTETGTGGFIFGVLGSLFAGWFGVSIPFGAIGIALGVAAGGAAVIFASIKLWKVIRKKRFKKKITAAAEEYKELYKDVMQGVTVELSKQMKKAGENADVDKLKKLCQKKVELKKQKMDLVDKEITDKISDMTFKGGKNDPELHAWKTQEFNRVRVEALQEIIDEEEKELDDNIIEAINKNITKYKEHAQKLSKMSFELKKDAVIELKLTDEEVEKYKELFELKAKSVKESYNDKFEFYGSLEFLNESFLYEAESSEPERKLYDAKVLYNSDSEGIKEYLDNHKDLDSSMVWTVAQDEKEVKDVDDKHKALWYDGAYIYTITKEEAAKKMAGIVDDVMTVGSKDIDALKKQAKESPKKRDGEKISGSLVRLAYGLAILPLIKKSYTEVKLNGEEEIQKNLLFSLDFSENAKDIKEYGDDNNLAKIAKACNNANLDITDSLLDGLKKATKDATKDNGEKDKKKEEKQKKYQEAVDGRIDSISDKLESMDYDEEDFGKACDALRDDLSKVSNNISSSSSDNEDENESKIPKVKVFEDIDDEDYSDGADSNTMLSRKIALACAFKKIKGNDGEDDILLVSDETFREFADLIDENEKMSKTDLIRHVQFMFKGDGIDEEKADDFKKAIDKLFNEAKENLEKCDDISKNHLNKFIEKLNSIKPAKFGKFCSKLKDIVQDKHNKHLYEQDVYTYQEYLEL